MMKLNDIQSKNTLSYYSKALYQKNWFFESLIEIQWKLWGFCSSATPTQSPSKIPPY